MRRELAAIPELFVVDPVASLDFPVLLRAPWLDVAMLDAGLLDSEGKGDRELGAVVGLELAYRERQALAKLAQEGKARRFVAPAVQSEDAISGAVVQSRVLVAATFGRLDDLHVDLNGVPGLILLEQQ